MYSIVLQNGSSDRAPKSDLSDVALEQSVAEQAKSIREVDVKAGHDVHGSVEKLVAAGKKHETEARCESEQ